MQKYTHLTESERRHVYLMQKQQKSLTEIAKSMDRSPATISREIKRSTGKRGYRHKQTHGLACSRHKGKNKRIKAASEVKCQSPKNSNNAGVRNKLLGACG